MKTQRHLRMLALAIGLVLGLAGCERQPPQSATQEAAAPTPPAPTPGPAVTPAQSPAPAPAMTRVDAPIDPAEIAARIELIEAPLHVRANDTLLVRLRVHNDGSHVLVSAGERMVNLGAMLVGPQGIDTPPGMRDFVRTALPLLQPGDSVEVQAELPAAALLGLPVRFELVQEGVNWFAAYGQPSLDLGPYSRCSTEAEALCDSAGAAVASQ